MRRPRHFYLTYQSDPYDLSTKLKPYVCGIQGCKSAFGDPSSCARHRKETHRNVGAYQCPHPRCKSRCLIPRHWSCLYCSLLVLASNAAPPSLLISGSTTSILTLWTSKLWRHFCGDRQCDLSVALPKQRSTAKGSHPLTLVCSMTCTQFHSMPVILPTYTVSPVFLFSTVFGV